MLRLMLKKIDLNNSVLSWGIILTICCVAIASRHAFSLNADVEWLALAAERWLKGQTFEQGIYELNTPFSVILYTPSVIVSSFIPLSVSLITYILTTACILISICACSHILQYRGYEGFDDRVNRNIFKISFTLVLLFFSSLSFSQRDHLIAVFMLPYAMLKFAPLGYKEHALERKYWVNILCSVMLSLAVLIKPPYAIAAFLIHLVSIRVNKKVTVFWPGFILFSGVMIVGLLSVIVVFPGWIQIAKDAMKTYPGYQIGWGKTVLSLGEGIITQFLAIVIFYKIISPSSRINNRFFLSLLCLAAANAVIFIVQQKGWFYQRLPLTLPLWGMVVFNFFLYCYKQKNTWIWGLLAAGVLINHLSLYVLDTDLYIRKNPEDPINRYEWAKEAKLHLKKNDAFTCISYSMDCPFMLTHVGGPYAYVSRYPVMWPTGGAKVLLNKGELDRSVFLSYLNRDINNVVEDINMNHPELIIVEWNSKHGHIEDFSENKMFSAMLQRYRLIKRYDANAQISVWLYKKSA